MLLTDTVLPVEDIAGISGFETSQDMLSTLAGLYGRDPLAFRKPLAVETHPGVKSCALMLSYRPPFDWSALLNYFRTRAVSGLEKIADGVYLRT